MKLNYKLNLPQKSILGFKVLSSFQSSISCYILLLFRQILDPLFGFSQRQIIAGSLFHIVLNISILILIINLIIKKNQLKTLNFIVLNSILFIYLPIALHDIGRYIKIIIFSQL